MKIINLVDIETPKTVEEFRKNLKRFFITSEKYGLHVMRGSTTLEVLQGQKGDESTLYIPLDEISSFSDIYRLTKTGFYGDGRSPNIVPISHHHELPKFIHDNDISLVKMTEVSNEDEIDDMLERPLEYPLSWYSLDNQILRILYSKILGEFSGYIHRFDLGTNYLGLPIFENSGMEKVINELNLSPEQIMGIPGPISVVQSETSVSQKSK